MANFGKRIRRILNVVPVRTPAPALSTVGGAMLNTDRIIDAAESLADAVEDFLYSEESDRNALRDAWLHYVGVADDEYARNAS